MSWRYYETLVRILRGQIPAPPALPPSFIAYQNLAEGATITITGPPNSSLGMFEFIGESAMITITGPPDSSLSMFECIGESAMIKVVASSPIGVASAIQDAVSESVSLIPKTTASNTIGESVGIKVA